MRLGLYGGFMCLAAIIGCGSDVVPVDSGTGGAGAGAGTGAAPTGGNNPSGVTWWEDVAPVVYERCVSCHIDGGIAPFNLVEYEDAERFAAAMATSVQTRTMPPWGVDNSGDCNTYKDARWLSQEEIDVFQAWVDAGVQQGDPASAPSLPGPPSGLSEVTHTIDIGVDYTPSEAEADDYRCFIVDPGNADDMFLAAYEVKPGDARVVHHVILYSLDGSSAEAEAAALDAQESGPGYSCYGGTRVSGSNFIGGWAPGTPPTIYPPGTGVRLTGGQKAVLQIHYNTVNGSFSDRTTMDLTLVESANEAYIAPMLASDLALPPAMDYIQQTNTENNPAPLPVKVHAVFPHMHELGVDLRLDAVRSSGDVCLVDVPRWDFNWQQLYLYTEPVELLPTDQLRISCGYNTEGRTETVYWGDGTQDEMCINFLYVTL